MEKETIDKIKRGDILSMRGLLFFALGPFRLPESHIRCAYNKEGAWVEGDVTFELLNDTGFVHVGTVRELISIFMAPHPILDIVEPSPQSKNAAKRMRKKIKDAQKKRR